MIQKERAAFTLTLPPVPPRRGVARPRRTVSSPPADSEGCANWSGPEGFTLLACETDFLSGGVSRLRLRSPEGRDYWVDGVRLEIVEPERIVFAANPAVQGQTPSELSGVITFRRIEGARE